MYFSGSDVCARTAPNDNLHVLQSKTFSVEFNQNDDLTPGVKITNCQSRESNKILLQEQRFPNCGKDQRESKTNAGFEDQNIVANGPDYMNFRKTVDNNEKNLNNLTETPLANRMLHSNFIKKTHRKNSRPIRSAEKCDPNFRGVSFRLLTRMQGDESRLTISAYFCNIKNAGGSPRNRIRYNSGSGGSYGDQWSCSDDENCSPSHKDVILFSREGKHHQGGLHYPKEGYVLVKTCASCGTRRTPLWRDAEDGTPLCNACGIRFKKYKVRCSQCWHIPKKDIKTFPNCPSCGATLRMSVCRRTW